MTPEQVIARFEGIKRGRSAGRRAPHKPLLLLHALARFSEGEERLRYAEVETRVRKLLRDFGPRGSSNRIYYPFWRLQTDGLWVVEEPLVPNYKGDVQRKVLKDRDSVGRFSDDVAAVLRADSSLVAELIDGLLAREFTEAYDDDILTSIGFDFENGWVPTRGTRRRRSSKFRRQVMEAYAHRCAVCGFSAKVGDAHVGIDAAHVIWHQHDGPDEVDNGLALCALHHRLFDRGAFTLSPLTGGKWIVDVSKRATGNDAFGTWLRAFQGKPLAEPIHTAQRVSEPAMAWHWREVFKGRPRT